MNWRRIGSREAWRGLALEAAWKFVPRRENEKLDLTWDLHSGELEQMFVVWPLKYGWSSAGKWVNSLLHGFRKYVGTDRSDVPQIFNGILLLNVIIRGVKHNVAIDYADRPEINESCAKSCPIYFKMQFSSEGYPFRHVLPGGFVPNSESIYQYMPHVRALADKKAYLYDVYGRFGLEFAADIRRKACSLLARQQCFRWEGSLHIKRYSLALRESARSKICIDLPGNGDFCFRLIDYFAVGACVIAPKHNTVLHVPLEDGKDIIYVKRDLSDLVEACKFYLENDTARKEVSHNSRLYFDKYLHRDQLAAYYLRSCLDRLS